MPEAATALPRAPSASQEGKLVVLTALCVALVLFAGLMSGLTLGLLGMDVIDLEVLKRSGSAKEKRRAEVGTLCQGSPKQARHWSKVCMPP